MHLRCPQQSAPTAISLYTGLSCACFKHLSAKFPFVGMLSLGSLAFSARPLEPAQPCIQPQPLLPGTREDDFTEPGFAGTEILSTVNSVCKT